MNSFGSTLFWQIIWWMTPSCWDQLIVVMNHHEWPRWLVCTIVTFCHVKIVLRWLVCYHPDLKSSLTVCIFALWLYYSKGLIEVWDLDSTFQPAASKHAASYTLYTLPLPIEVNPDVIFSLFQSSLVPHGVVELAFFSRLISFELHWLLYSLAALLS